MHPYEIALLDELLEPYRNLDLSVPGYRERTTAAKILLRVSAQAVINARRRYPYRKVWNNTTPRETATTVGNYIKALRTGTVKAFNAQLDQITDPTIRHTHLMCMNAMSVFVEYEESDRMKTIDDVLDHIQRVQSYD
jgi:hypothetical protein